jgi:hypothetical protein
MKIAPVAEEEMLEEIAEEFNEVPRTEDLQEDDETLSSF